MDAALGGRGDALDFLDEGDRKVAAEEKTRGDSGGDDPTGGDDQTPVSDPTSVSTSTTPPSLRSDPASLVEAARLRPAAPPSAAAAASAARALPGTPGRRARVSRVRRVRRRALRASGGASRALPRVRAAAPSSADRWARFLRSLGAMYRVTRRESRRRVGDDEGGNAATRARETTNASRHSRRRIAPPRPSRDTAADALAGRRGRGSEREDRNRAVHWV